MNGLSGIFGFLGNLFGQGFMGDLGLRLLAWLGTLPVWIVFILGQIQNGCAADPNLVNRTMVVDGDRQTYSVWVPPGYDPEQQWPLIVFLHGLIMWGDNGVLHTADGIAPALRESPDLYPCLVLIPQLPLAVDWTLNGSEYVDVALAQTLAEFSVDPDRIYLTGLSSGGFGTWSYGADHIDTFAALMPIGSFAFSSDIDELATVPIWAFHGGVDELVPVEAFLSSVEAIQAAGGDIRWTVYPDLGHLGTWDRAYHDPEVIEWLLSQRRNGP